MVFELIELAIIIGALYLSAFEWIKKRDIQSNEKNDFFIPAAFLGVVMLLFIAGGVSGEGFFLPFVSMICGIAAIPLVISLVLTGMAQDQQKLDGDLTYNVGDKFWIIHKEDISLTTDQAFFIGKQGEINEIKAEGTASMTFDEDPDISFPLESLSKLPPNSEKPEKKNWWQ
ncbi:MAG: hypothetical protein VX224_04755 [Candidatus Thermoplasmatota archaeon]|nr:hypothetical protein [Candidatus Thermoplasmatota archaeon]